MPYDAAQHTLVGKAGSCRVSPAQHELLVRLQRSNGALVEHQALIDAIWRRRDYKQPSFAKARMTLKVEVHHLRARLRDTGAPEQIITIGRLGYALRGPSREERPVWLTVDQRTQLRALLRACTDPRARKLAPLVPA